MLNFILFFRLTDLFILKMNQTLSLLLLVCRDKRLTLNNPWRAAHLCNDLMCMSPHVTHSKSLR